MSNRKVITLEPFCFNCKIKADGKCIPYMGCAAFHALPDAEPIIEAAETVLEANHTSPWLDDLKSALDAVKEKR